jgi:hypothetical protein
VPARRADATICAQFPGIIEWTDDVQLALAQGQGTNFAAQYFRVTPRLETGDATYSWVNQSVFVVGEGGSSTVSVCTTAWPNHSGRH